LKEQLKRLVGPRWQVRVQRLGRLRWVTKYRMLRGHGARLRDRPLRYLAYVLLDPEVESYTYELANEDDVLEAIATALSRPREEIDRYAAEARDDPELGDRLSRRLRWRLDVKRRPPLGKRLAWYVFARALKPRTLVETGTYRGLGSLVLLRALERNAREGHEGELISVDGAPSAGDIVAPELRARWRCVIGSTFEVLPAVVGSRSVEMLVQDTPHTKENEGFEFGLALAHATDRLLLIGSSSSRAATLERLAREHGAPYHRVAIEPRDHFCRPSGLGFALFDSTAE
jgi:hypothetical protein